jgi:hypothetical protein
LRIFDLPGELFRGVPPVQWRQHDSCPRRGVNGEDIARFIRRENPYALAGISRRLSQNSCRSGNCPLQLSERPLLPAEAQRDPGRVCPSRDLEKVGEQE